MDAATVRKLAAGLALNRMAFGLGYLGAPERAGTGWIAGAAHDPRTQIFIRALGARDLALGAGALRTLLARDPAARQWFAAHALADGADLAATLAARRELPWPNVIFASAMAGASTAIAVAAALRG